MSRRTLIEPARVREVRASLKLSQRKFAERLGVSRRTVIRGEQRGLEVPWATWKPRGAVRFAWDALEEDADCARVKVSPGDTSTIAKVSPRPKRKRLRLSHELLADKKRRTRRAPKREPGAG